MVDTLAIDRPEPFAHAVEAAAALRTATGIDHYDLAVVLGSGWAAAADGLGSVVADLDLSDLPGFPAPRVAGHRNLARSVQVDDSMVLVLGGRVHLYEEYTPAQVVHGVRAAAAAGCRGVILTNAAGGINPALSVGAPVLIADQLNLTGRSPMSGPEPPAGRPGRFCDMTDAFSPRVRALARELDPGLPEGIYAGMFGGAYETPAEVRMLAGLGADVVGMSTVLEAVAARHLGLEVLGLSLVTNMAAGVSDAPLAHAEVLAVAEDAGPAMVELIGGVLRRW